MSDGASQVQPAAAMPAAAPRPRSRTGLWVSLVVLAIVVVIAGSCGLLTWAAMSGGDVATGDAVAVIYIDQEIAGVGGDLGSSITPEGIIDQLRKAENDSSVKAIILRIDSPGGTASASEEIATEVARVKKPIIASIGDIGASGAYMIASQCDVIMATPASDVGSIGVILGVTDLSALYDKLGVRLTYLHEGTYKDAGGSHRALTASETALFQADIHLVYEQFIDIVAKGRKMPVAEVEKLATGWAWPGARAKELGLVDKLGNYRDAVKLAGKLGKIHGEPRVVTYQTDSLTGIINRIAGAIGFGGIASLAPGSVSGSPPLPR